MLSYVARTVKRNQTACSRLKFTAILRTLQVEPNDSDHGRQYPPSDIMSVPRLLLDRCHTRELKVQEEIRLTRRV